MVAVGQEFKNYKALCLYLGEGVKTGKSKELQLKRWQLSFSWHKEGNKFVIDEVKRDYIRKSSGGNRKHVEAFLPYVIYCLNQSGIENDYIGTQRMMRSELKLVSSEIYDVYNHPGKDHTKYLYKHGISDYNSLRLFVHYFEVYCKETLNGCFNTLAKEEGMKWSDGQIFVVGMSHRKRVYTSNYAEVLDKIETQVCTQMNKTLKKELKGRQLLHYIKQDKEIMEEFYKKCIAKICKDRQLIAEIKEKYEGKYKQKFIPEMIEKYYRLYYIDSIDRKKIRKWKLDKIDGLRLKKAFVNSDGPELQMLKRKVYEDIFQRMANKDGKNKLGIPDGDFRAIRFLITDDNPKLTKKEYSPRKEENQDGNIRTETAEG